MSKTVNDPRDIFSEIINDYKGVFGDALKGIILYGSAAGDEYRPGISDINFMIILDKEEIENLDKAFSVVRKWFKRKVSIPLFLTEEYISASLDVFPVEYFNFKRQYIPVFGKDVLKEINFDRELMRLQCEREVKGKLLLLREAFLESSGKGRILKDVINRSTGAFSAIFEALLYIRDKEGTGGKREIIRATCESFGLDLTVFESLHEFKQGKLKLRDQEIRDLFKRYLKEIAVLSRAVDTMGG